VDWLARVRIAIGAAKGLAYLHAQGGPNFVHGNIKSSNILLNRDREACVADFGLSQLLSTSTSASKVVGYRAPEVAVTRKVTQKSDVYSFGVVQELPSSLFMFCIFIWEEYHKFICLIYFLASFVWHNNYLIFIWQEDCEHLFDLRFCSVFL